jgi:hypothetical protein
MTTHEMKYLDNVKEFTSSSSVIDELDSKWSLTNLKENPFFYISTGYTGKERPCEPLTLDNLSTLKNKTIVSINNNAGIEGMGGALMSSFNFLDNTGLLFRVRLADHFITFDNIPLHNSNYFNNVRLIINHVIYEDKQLILQLLPTKLLFDIRNIAAEYLNSDTIKIVVSDEDGLEHVFETVKIYSTATDRTLVISDERPIIQAFSLIRRDSTIYLCDV